MVQNIITTKLLTIRTAYYRRINKSKNINGFKDIIIHNIKYRLNFITSNKELKKE